MCVTKLKKVENNSCVYSKWSLRILDDSRIGKTVRKIWFAMFAIGLDIKDAQEKECDQSK